MVNDYKLPNITNPMIGSIQFLGLQQEIDVTFPFMIATGKNAALLVNLKTREAQVLMTTVPPVRDQKKALQFVDVLDGTLDEKTGKPLQNAIKCLYAT